jgi:hypothetical protein
MGEVVVAVSDVDELPGALVAQGEAAASPVG